MAAYNITIIIAFSSLAVCKITPDFVDIFVTNRTIHTPVLTITVIDRIYFELTELVIFWTIDKLYKSEELEIRVRFRMNRVCLLHRRRRHGFCQYAVFQHPIFHSFVGLG